MPKKIITLDELSRYDENIKNYTSFRLLNSANLVSLTTSSTEAQIMNAFGGTDEFNNFIEDVLKQKRILVGAKTSSAVLYSEADIYYENKYGMLYTLSIHYVVPRGFSENRLTIYKASGSWSVSQADHGAITLDLESCTNSEIDNLFTNGGGE